jgi:ATP-dependent protease ClpP protease subunit
MRKSDLQQLVYDVHNFLINYATRELYLHGAHAGQVDDGEPGVEYRMATTFVKNLHILEQQGEGNVLIHMHTIGGNWSDGMAIYNSMMAASFSTTILGYAQASSMSGVVLQGADKRVLMPDCEFMVHHGSIYLDDNSIAAKSAVEMNERNCKRMLQIFARRAINGQFFKQRNYSEAQIIHYINRKIKDKSDWYMSAEEAVDMGFADGVLGEKGFENAEKIRVVRKIRP